ncbi:MAG: MFS transporter [Gammaproteobacteria bacterium]
MKHIKQSVIVLTLCALFLFLKYIAQLYPALISDILIQKFALSGLEIGILASSYYYSYTLMQLVSGILLDQYDIRLPAFFAMLCVSLGLYSFAHTDSFVCMCLSRVLMGVGCSFATTLYMKASTLWTSNKIFTIIASFLATATMLGAAIGAAPIALLFNYVGWRYGLVLLAIVGIVISICSLFWVHNPKQIRVHKPESVLKHLKTVICKSENIWLLVYSGITFSPVVILGGLWGVPFLQLKFHAQANQVATLISTMFVGHAVGSPVWAILSTVFNLKKPFMVMANLAAFLCLVLIIYCNMTFMQAEALFFIFGFCVGCFMLSFSICREVNQAVMMGFAVAFINSGEGIVSSIIDPGIGLFLDLMKQESSHSFTLQSYQYALIVLPLSYIVSTMTIFKLPKETRPQSVTSMEIDSTLKQARLVQS